MCLAVVWLFGFIGELTARSRGKEQTPPNYRAEHSLAFVCGGKDCSWYYLTLSERIKYSCKADGK